MISGVERKWASRIGKKGIGMGQQLWLADFDSASHGGKQCREDFEALVRWSDELVSATHQLKISAVIRTVTLR